MDNVRDIMNTEMYNVEDDLNSMITLLKLNKKSFNNCSIKFSISDKCSTLYKCSLHSYTITCNIFYDMKLKSISSNVTVSSFIFCNNVYTLSCNLFISHIPLKNQIH